MRQAQQLRERESALQQMAKEFAELEAQLHEATHLANSQPLALPEPTLPDWCLKEIAEWQANIITSNEPKSDSHDLVQFGAAAAAASTADELHMLNLVTECVDAHEGLVDVKLVPSVVKIQLEGEGEAEGPTREEVLEFKKCAIRDAKREQGKAEQTFIEALCSGDTEGIQNAELNLKEASKHLKLQMNCTKMDKYKHVHHGGRTYIVELD